MPIKINTDGGTRANPGAGAWGVVIVHPSQGKTKLSGFMEHTTNNEAEYEALNQALGWLQDRGHVNENVMIFTDSEVMVKQVTGVYEVRAENLLPYWALATAYLEDLKLKGVDITLQHIKREFNSEADALCNEVMDAHQVVAKKKGKK